MGQVLLCRLICGAIVSLKRCYKGTWGGFIVAPLICFVIPGVSLSGFVLVGFAHDGCMACWHSCLLNPELMPLS